MAKKKSPIDFGDNRIWLGDNEAKRKANTVFEKMGMPSEYQLQYIAEKDMKGQSNKAVKAKKQRNMSAIRDSGKEYNRKTEQGDVWDGPDNARTVYTMYKGKSYFGETKKKTKRPTLKKK